MVLERFYVKWSCMRFRIIRKIRIIMVIGIIRIVTINRITWIIHIILRKKPVLHRHSQRWDILHVIRDN